MSRVLPPFVPDTGPWDGGAAQHRRMAVTRGECCHCPSCLAHWGDEHLDDCAKQ